MAVVRKIPRNAATPDKRKKYPWDEWLDPEHAVRLYRGTDFHGSTDSLLGSAWGAARTRGGRTRTQRGMENGCEYVDIVFTPDSPRPAAGRFMATPETGEIFIEDGRIRIEIGDVNVWIESSLFPALREAMNKIGRHRK